MSLVDYLPFENNEVARAAPESPRVQSFSTIRNSDETPETKVGPRKCSIGLLTELLRKRSASIVDA